jgi:hypothetical protein
MGANSASRYNNNNHQITTIQTNRLHKNNNYSQPSFMVSLVISSSEHDKITDNQSEQVPLCKGKLATTVFFVGTILDGYYQKTGLPSSHDAVIVSALLCPSWGISKAGCSRIDAVHSLDRFLFWTTAIPGEAKLGEFA